MLAGTVCISTHVACMHSMYRRVSVAIFSLQENSCLTTDSIVCMLTMSGGAALTTTVYGKRDAGHHLEGQMSISIVLCPSCMVAICHGKVSNTY